MEAKTNYQHNFVHFWGGFLVDVCGGYILLKAVLTS